MMMQSNSKYLIQIKTKLSPNETQHTNVSIRRRMWYCLIFNFALKLVQTTRNMAFKAHEQYLYSFHSEKNRKVEIAFVWSADGNKLIC